MTGRVAPFVDLEHGVVSKSNDAELTETSQLPGRTVQKSVHDNTASNVRRRNSGTRSSPRDEIELSLQNLAMTQQLPSHSSQRSIHRIGVRRNSARRASMRNDIELLSAVDFANDLDVEEELADPKNVTRSMSERRRFRKSIKDREKVVRGLKKNRISKWKEFKMRFAMSWKLTKSSISHWSRDYEVWKGHLKRVEGRFGTGVSSFFVFLKSLLFLNITTFILEFGLVTLPSVIIENNITSGANTNSCYFDELQTQNETSFMLTVTQQAADFISGKGWINTTVMFYAGYPASKLVSDAGIEYNLPLAYLLVGCSYFVCSLVMVVRSLGTSIQESYIESGGTSTSCSNSIFAAWDFCITNENTAKAKTQTIAQNFRAQFAEEERRIKVESRTTQAKCGLYILRAFSTLLVLALLGGAIYAIVFAVAISTDPEYEQKAREAFEGGEKLLLFGPSLVITVLNFVLPLIFDFLSRFEDWSPGFEVNITLFRTVLVRLASIGVLMIKIYAKVDEGCEDNPQTCCQQNWENEIASQMYMLIWLDFFSHIFSSLVLTTIRKLLYEYTESFKKVGLPVFDIPKQVLRLVYGECLIWIGTFFSPVMPAMGIVKLFIIFYVELLAVLLNYRPSQKVYRATRSNHLFTVLLLITFFMCLGTVGWGIAGVRPSCVGPFSNVYCKADARFYDVLQVQISSWPSWIQQIISFVTTVTFIFPILTVVCLLLLYFKSMTTSLLLTIETLKDQLALDGRDKRFLMEKLFRYEMAYGKDMDDELYSSGSVKPKQLNHVNSTKERDSLAPPDDLMLQVNLPKKRDSLAPPGDLMF